MLPANLSRQKGVKTTLEVLLSSNVGKTLCGNSGLSLLQCFSTYRGCSDTFCTRAMAACSFLFSRVPLASSSLSADHCGTSLSATRKKINCPKKLYGGLKIRDSLDGDSCNQCGLPYSTWIRWNSSPFQELGTKKFHSSCSSSYSAGTAHDISFDGSVTEDRLDQSASHDQKAVGGRTLKLLSGSSCLPHPDKEETGGEDAHFMCDGKQAIGVADGVGGWADVGVNAGYYSRELMSNAVAAIQEELEDPDPSKILEKAHSSTKAKGSSTACIITLVEQGIHAVNLGDSGFIVVRDGCTIFRSPSQQHDFNFTYQLECGNNSDLPSSAQVFKFPVSSGDVIVAGTDGLFDNLYNNEITAVVVHATRTGLDPQVTAQKIAALARQRALDKNRQTPFSAAAQEAGYRYYGGKLDDITVVVSYVTASSSK